MLKSNFEFEVLVHGSSVKEYYHQGSHYIEGKEGTKFSLRMRNNSGNRVLFVPTVDGLSIMNGKEGSFKSSGYIVDAYDALTIDGWRTSDDKVAEFFFSSPKESYAKKINKEGNLGVIGCAVFKEKEYIKLIEKKIIEKEYIPYPVYPYPTYPEKRWDCPFHKYWQNCPCNNNGTASGITSFQSNSFNNGSINLVSSAKSSSFLRSAATPTSSVSGLGTGFGQDKYSPVVKVDFEKESSPAEVFSIYYNTRKNLEDLGIEFRKVIYTSPSAFPNEEGYCKRPN